MLQVLLIFVAILWPHQSLGGESLSNVTGKCLKLASDKELACLPNTVCPSKSVQSKVSECLRKIGLNDFKCTMRYQRLSCSGSSEKIFDQTLGCKLHLTFNNSGRPEAYVANESSGICVVNGYTLHGASVDVARSVKKSSGRWQIDSPIVALGFDKFVPPKDIVVLSIALENDHEVWPGSEGVEACRHDTETIQRSVKKSSERQVAERLGFKSTSEITPERHFTALKGSKNIPIITEFRFKREVSLCGVKLKPDVVLRLKAFDHAVCSTLSRGAVTIDGFPRKLFPDIPTDGVAPDIDVECAPVAQKAADLRNFLDANGPGIVPDPDWNYCDCKFPDPPRGN